MSNLTNKALEVSQRICEIEERLACRDLTVHEADDLRYEKADDTDAAKTAVLQDWPEAKVWRFCVEKEDAMLSDRFPFTDWMLERLPC